VAMIDRRGKVTRRTREEFDIGYRHCVPKPPRKEWFAAAWLKLKPGDGDTSRGIMKELLARRIATQPLSLPNAGSVFRNPPRDHAARLIEACGLKGVRVGGAAISPKHANVIVNLGGASAADVLALMVRMRDAVRDRFGITLSPEVELLGMSWTGRL
jgi:UDP-N-acetylmuramate dehydrogenase